ncbi:UNVERIFIED_CONTAM: hypothetical protein GTU68_004567 [Idotea baltica]|nr:hypothetical protein [Idotea baltica]
MDSRQLLAFRELARQGSFTGAAGQLHLTQSAISHSIKALETHLNAQLFRRLGKRVQLTIAGEALLPHVEKILHGMEVAQADIVQIQRPGHGRLRIGSTVTISQYVLPSILRELRECFPNFDISVATDDSSNLMTLLSNGAIDVAVALEAQSAGSHFDFTTLFVDEIAMAIAPVHPLAKKERPSKKDISGEDFIFYDKSSETFQLVQKMFTEMKMPLQASLQVGSMAAIKEMAKIGMGVGLMAPWIALDEISNGTLIFRPLPVSNVSRNWGIYSDRRVQSEFVKEVFTGICQNVVTTLQQQTDKKMTESNVLIA